MRSLSLSKKLCNNSKGVYSIIAAVFMVLVVLVLYTNVFAFMLNQNVFLHEVVSEANQVDIDRSNEIITVTDANYTVEDDQIYIEATIINNGPVSVQIITLWAFDATTRKYGYNDTLSINLKTGDTIVFAESNALIVTIEGSDSSDVFACWFVTARGNLIPFQEEQGVIVSSVTGGIGAIKMNFEDFKYYNVTKQGSSYFLDGYPDGVSGYFVNKGGVGIAFQVSLTNLDRNNRDIDLSSASVLFSMFPTTPQQIRGAYWYLVNVDGNGVIADTFTTITLPYKAEKTIFFASSEMIQGSTTFSPSSSGFLGTAPVNLALIGNIINNSSKHTQSWPCCMYVHTIETDDYLYIQYGSYYSRNDKLCGLEVPFVGAHIMTGNLSMFT